MEKRTKTETIPTESVTDWVTQQLHAEATRQAEEVEHAIKIAEAKTLRDDEVWERLRADQAERWQERERTPADEELLRQAERALHPRPKPRRRERLATDLRSLWNAVTNPSIEFNLDEHAPMIRHYDGTERQQEDDGDLWHRGRWVARERVWRCRDCGSTTGPPETPPPNARFCR